MEQNAVDGCITECPDLSYSTFGSNGNLPNDFTSNFAPSDIEIKTDFVFGYNFLFGGSLMRMKKIKQHHLFFDNNYKLSTGEDHQYIIDCFPFMKFANLDKVLYQYRQDSTQTTAINKKQVLNNACVIIRKHLLKFNIKPDLEIIRFFLPDNKEELDSQKFQKALKIAIQIFNIRNFYGYPSVDKKNILKQFYQQQRKTERRGFSPNNHNPPQILIVHQKKVYLF